MSRQASPFTGRTVLLLLVAGALFFVTALWAIGAGETGGDENNGGGHAASAGLNGYAAIVQLLEGRGYDVTVSRDQNGLETADLLVVTPPLNADGEDIAQLLEDRAYAGPTVLVLPKWPAFLIPPTTGVEYEDGWVMLGDPMQPRWVDDEDAGVLRTLDPELSTGDDEARWSGFGLSGQFPQDRPIRHIAPSDFEALVTDAQGQMLAGYWRDGGYYPALEDASGAPMLDAGSYDDSRWPILIVAEPDLMNNYGMAEEDRARLAVALVEGALDGYDLGITFDVTLNGLGANTNLLTLAFTPPFLAATLCLILAGCVIAWRAFHRFGPAVTGGPALAFGKAQLVANNAALVVRAQRPHLLGAPYARMLQERIARALGLPTHMSADTQLAEIDRRLELRGIADRPASGMIAELSAARTDAELVRRAEALSEIERKLHQ